VRASTGTCDDLAIVGIVDDRALIEMAAYSEAPASAVLP
jgi:hypothetical protein